MICSNSFAPTSDVGDTRGGADEPIEIESSSDEEVYHIIHVYKGRSHEKKTVKKGDIVHWWGGGVNPSSFFKPKFTGFSNHSEMDF